MTIQHRTVSFCLFVAVISLTVSASSGIRVGGGSSSSVLRDKVRRLCPHLYYYLWNGGVLTVGTDQPDAATGAKKAVHCSNHTGQNGFCSKQTCLMYDPSLLVPYYYTTRCLGDSAPLGGKLPFSRYVCQNLPTSNPTYQLAGNCHGLAVYRLATELSPSQCRVISNKPSAAGWPSSMQ